MILRRAHNIRFFLLLLIISCSFTSCRRSSIFFHPLLPETKKLSQGMKLFYLKDSELPLVNLFFYIRGGSVYDPVGKEGLSAIAMQSIRLGGMKGLPSQRVEDRLEFCGASLEMGSSPEFFTVSFSLLEKDLNQGLEILFGLLKNPSLDPEHFRIIKARAKDSLHREEEDPLHLAMKEYPGMIYGNNVWGRKVTEDSLDRITLEDVKNFQEQFIHPDRIVVAVAGDISKKDLIQKLESYLGDWKISAGPLPSIPPVESHFEPVSRVIIKKGLTQSTVIVGHLGGRRDNPDKFALQIMNFILGGSGALTSRMGEAIRSDTGKAYSVWSDFGIGKDLGIFRAVAQTAIQNTDWVTQKMSSMIRELATEPHFTEEEIDRAKKSLLRGMVFDYETRFSQVKEQARLHLLGYPNHYLEILQRKMGEVTRGDLERVSKKYLHPDGLKILIVTDESAKGKKE